MTFKFKNGLPPTVPYVGLADSGNIITPTLNRAILIPIWLPRWQQFSAFRFVRQSAAAGQIDLGIYRPDFTRIFSLGSTAYPVTPPTISTLPFPGGFIGLAPGPFWLAFSLNGATSFFGEVNSILCTNCLRTLAASFPLPAVIAGSSLAAVDVPALAIV